MKVIKMLDNLKERWKKREERRNITKRIMWGALAGMIASLIILFLLR